MSSHRRRPALELSHRLLIAALWSAVSLTSAHAAAVHDDEPVASTAEAPRKAGAPKKSKAADPAVAADEAVAASAAAKRAPPRDPMDVIRERLAAKLGAGKVAESATPGVVKVVSQTAAVPTGGVSRSMVSPVSNQARAIAAGPTHAAAREAAASHAVASGHAGEPWAYEGPAGPAAWGELKPEFSTCASGARQSPIDITDGIKVELDAVQFDYRPSNFRVIDNGHTVQVNLAVGNTIEVTGKRYELVQFHFHRPSEERINGKPFDMVVHLVHKSVEGKLAVIAVLLERGSAQSVVQTVWNNLPLEKGDEVMAKGQIDLMALLPTDRRYYTYMGSLTTPPCSEGVLWMVMKTPVQLSAEQLAIFTRLYPMNARPIQSAGGRIIKESN
jgi:carbonic anhydrase